MEDVKIDIEKFITDILSVEFDNKDKERIEYECESRSIYAPLRVVLMAIDKTLNKQGLVYKDGKIETEFQITDIKPGDILYCKSPNSDCEYIMIFKKLNEYGHADSYCRYSSLDGFDVDVYSVLNIQNDKPTLATEEQKNKLFTSMAEAGYEWDAERLELTEVEPEDGEKVNIDGMVYEFIDSHKEEIFSSEVRAYRKGLQDMYDKLKGKKQYDK